MKNNPQRQPLTPLAEWVIKTDKELQDIKFAIIDLQNRLQVRALLEEK